jgi:hypothetical protein
VCCANRRISYYNFTAKSKMNSPSLLNASTQEIKKYPDNSILSRKVAPKTGKYKVDPGSRTILYSAKATTWTVMKGAHSAQVRLRDKRYQI